MARISISIGDIDICIGQMLTALVTRLASMVMDMKFINKIVGMVSFFLACGKANNFKQLFYKYRSFFVRSKFFRCAGIKMRFQHLALYVSNMTLHCECYFQYLWAVRTLLDHFFELFAQAVKALECIESFLLMSREHWGFKIKG